MTLSLLAAIVARNRWKSLHLDLVWLWLSQVLCSLLQPLLIQMWNCLLWLEIQCPWYHLLLWLITLLTYCWGFHIEAVEYSLHDHLRVSMLILIYSKYSFFWWKLSDALMYWNNHKSLGVGLLLCPSGGFSPEVHDMSSYRFLVHW